MNSFHKNKMPQSWILKFFRWYCHPDYQEDIEGDLMERFETLRSEKGYKSARRLLIMDVMKLFRPGIIKPIVNNQKLNSIIMYKSYLKIGWRNLLRNRGYSIINISGLSLGMAVAILIGLWIHDEWSFDRQFEHHENLVQLMILQEEDDGSMYAGTTISPAASDPLKTAFGNHFKAMSMASFQQTQLIAVEEKKLRSQGIWVEAEFPRMFTLNMLSGTETILTDPSSLLISNSLAVSLFGVLDPLNKTIRLNNQQDMVIGGVYEDFPRNSSFASVNLLLPWSNQSNGLQNITSWRNHSCHLYAQLKENTGISQLNSLIKSLPTPHIQDWKEEIMFYPMYKMHLFGEFENGISTGGRIQFVRFFGLIGIFVLLLACINFINLSTARSGRRAKEVGIRKTIGSVKSQLVNQFLTESVLLAGIAMIFSLLIIQISLPYFNLLSEKQMQIPWNNPVFWLSVLGFTLLSGLLSGSYPAFYLSSFQPVKILKGALKSGKKASLPRKVLVIIQFTVSIALIIGTITVYQQIQYAKNRPAGYTRNGLISIYMNQQLIREKYELLRHEFMNVEAVQNFTGSSQTLAHYGNNTSVDWPGKVKESALLSTLFFRNVNVTPDFGETIGWKIINGRDFSREFTSDSSAVIVNKKAIEIMGFTDPIGQTISSFGNDYQIIGVTENMVTQSPYDPVEPTIYFLGGFINVITIKLDPKEDLKNGLEEIKHVFEKYNPGIPFDFSFVDESYARKYASEQRIGDLGSIFSGLAIFISCLGLFGLASYTAAQRSKEISIRKILGATVTSLWHLLSREFLILVILSIAIASIMAGYFMNNWLNQYAYRVEQVNWVFVVSGLSAVLVTLITVSIQSIKVALSNPLKHLRSE